MEKEVKTHTLKNTATTWDMDGGQRPEVRKPLRALGALLGRKPQTPTHTFQGSLAWGFPKWILDTLRFLCSDMRAQRPKFWPMSLICRPTKIQTETKRKYSPQWEEFLRAVRCQRWEGGLSRKPYPTSPFCQMGRVVIREMNFFLR